MLPDQIDVDQALPKGEKEMSFLDHLEELRWHLVRSILAIVVIAIVIFLAKDFVFHSIIFAPKYKDFITYRAICKLSHILGLGDSMCFFPPEFNFITPVLGELFITHIKTSIMLGVVLSFPYIFWEIWRFVRPGLYEKERNVTRGVVSICSILFLLGVLFGYFVISPFAVTFLAGYQIQGVTATPSLSSYVNYMIMFTVPAGLVFELPMVVYFLAKVGLVTADFMRRYRRHSIVIILTVAAIVTPPDVMTQFLIGIPLYFLDEASIFIAVRIEKQQAAKELALEKK